MRWNLSPKPVPPTHGDQRVDKRFLWKKLKLRGEYRWLEWANVEQVFRVYNYEESLFAIRQWEDVSFLPDGMTEIPKVEPELEPELEPTRWPTPNPMDEPPVIDQGMIRTVDKLSN